MATARLMYLLLIITANLVAFEANPEPENDCIFDESAAAAASIGCINERCSLDTDVCNGNRQCVCDGVCGYRCIDINNRKLCPPLPAPVNVSVVYKTNRAHGAKATYMCSPGYSLVNSTERTCLGDGQWTMDAAPTCLPNDDICPRLVSLTNSSAGNGSGCLPACTRRRDCPKKTQQTCTCCGACGMSCVDVFVQGYCPDIEVAEGTIILSVTPRGNMYTSVATIGCDDGYEMDTETQTQEISCMLTGQWNAQPARCTETVLCSPPPRVEKAWHNSRSRTFSPGDVLSYSCLAGYHHYGNAETSICLEDKLWTPVVMKCYAKSCGDPGFLRNGWRDGELFTFLSRVIYHCNEGYEMRGFAYRTCLSDGRWSSVMPSCEANPEPENDCIFHESAAAAASIGCINERCSLDTDICNGNRQCVCDGVCGYRCIDINTNPEPENDCIFDESAAAAASIGCNNKRCSLDTDVCNGNRQCVCDGVCGYRCININNRKLCPPLPAPVNGIVVYKTNRAHGAKATYKCSSGYSLVNSTERTCLGDGQWTMDAAPTCLPNDEICPRLVSLTNTSVGNGSGCLPACTRRRDCPKKTQQTCTCLGTCGMSCVDAFVQGYCPDIEVAEGTIILSVTPRGNMYTSVATIGCDDGYEMDTETQTQEISCMLTGQWNAQPARCTETVLCSPPPRVENARHNSRSRTFSPGDVLSYSCVAGYHHYGNAETSICLEDKLWTPVVMKCYAIECPALFAPDHGTVQGTRYDFNEQVYFACKDGYRLEGSPVRQCQADRTWSGEEVTCTGNRFVRCLETDTWATLPTCICTTGNVKCPLPPKPWNGQIKRVGCRSALVSCNPGFILYGKRRIRCTMTATGVSQQWPRTLCRARNRCNNPGNITDGDWELVSDDGMSNNMSSQFSPNTIINVTCTPGFALVGNPLVYCGMDGRWNSTIPTCEDYSECGYNGGPKNAVQSKGRISGGDNAPLYQWPWQVAIYKEEFGQKTFFCGGTIIAPNWVLTAARCLKGKTWDIIRVYTGVNDRSSIRADSPAYEVDGEDSYKVHENFNPTSLANDIALLRLSDSSTLGPKVRTVCVPQADMTEESLYTPRGEAPYVTGWGVTEPYDISLKKDSIECDYSHDETSTNRLQQLQIPVVTNEECKRSLRDKAYLCSSELDFKENVSFCAGYSAGGQDACEGDSGGPVVRELLLSDGTKRWVQIGIVSWGEGCAQEGRYGFYTKLSKYINWIHQHVGNSISFDINN
ncbi:clotting factor C-like isoform X3 [Asterias amurensis]|uniref:clotting factor C-like isoform X3 n=1 Tax=Asterias amurensis TaxID=7602 RepID=UPI003AB45A4E